MSDYKVLADKTGRLDKVVTNIFTDYTRSQLKKMIDDGNDFRHCSSIDCCCCS